MGKSTDIEEQNVDKDRRDFLKNSVYAAYATPLITVLLVDAKSAAAKSGCPPPCQWPGGPPGNVDCSGC